MAMEKGSESGLSNDAVPRQKLYYGLNHLHYVTRNTYRRARLFDSTRFKRRWVRALDEPRSELNFKIIGYVLMPEHFHRLIWPSADPNPSQILQKLEVRTALFILKNLKENVTSHWCRKMLNRVRLAATVHHHGHFRVWQRGGYDLNVWSPRKRDEKLNYMHNNPVTRKLVDKAGDWPWSSWRFYFLNDASILSMDRML
jgi:putative transposase